MISRWNTLRQRMRVRKLKHLRPGQNRDELLSIIRRAPAVNSEEERQSLQRFINFHELRIREIMTPRPDMISIDVESSIEQACQRMVENNLARMPVVAGSLDHIVGIIHIRSLFSVLVRQESPPLSALISAPIWVSELEKVTSLLSRMRSQSHIAIARDEFGSTAGLITLSDLLEEIFGNMNEFDDEQNEASADDILMARTRIEDLDPSLRLDLQNIDGDFDTLGGLLITLSGRIPQVGETIEAVGWLFTIEKASPRRIESVRISKQIKG